MPAERLNNTHPMRKVIRWTVGPVKQIGFDILASSVAWARNVFGGNVRLVVQYNGLDERQTRNVERLGVEVIRQDGLPNYRNISRTMFKFAPPRLDIEAHELVLDNDLLMRRLPPSVEEFFRSDAVLLCKEHWRAYGRYDRLIPEPFRVNAGLIGMPPGFDMGRAIKTIVPEPDKPPGGGDWQHVDEQGITVAALLTHGRFIYCDEIVIPHGQTKRGPCGEHYTGANWHGTHPAWTRGNSVLYL